MKKFYSSVIILSALVLSFTACKKKGDGLGIYTCTINDTIQWSATKETIALHAGIPLNIIGRDDNSTLIINLQDVNDAGVYQINDNSVHFAQYTDGAGTFDTYKNSYNSSGSVTITEISDTKVAGDFELHLSNSFVFKHFTQGHFDVSIE